MLPQPAPNSAAEAESRFCSSTPLTAAGTAMVAAMMAKSCWMANSTTCPNLGLSLMP